MLLKKIKNTINGSLLMADVGTKLLAFLLTPVYLYLMPKFELGEFGFIYSASASLTAIVSLGLYMPVIKLSASNGATNTNKQEIIASILFIITIITISMCAVLVYLEFKYQVFSYFFKIHSFGLEKCFLFCLLTIFLALNHVMYAYLLGGKINKYLVVYVVLRFLFSSILSLGLLGFDVNLYDKSIIRLGAVTLAEVGLFVVIYNNTFNSNKIKMRYSSVKLLMAEGIPMIWASIFYMITSNSDKYFIAKYHGNSELADFNLSMQMAATLQLIMSSIHSVWQPKLFGVKTNYEAYELATQFMKKTILAMTLVGFGIISTTYICLYTEIFPPSYAEVPAITISATLAVMTTLMLQIPFNLFLKYGKGIFVSGISLLVTALTVINGVLIISKHASIGATMGAAVINIICILLAIFLMKRYRSQVELKD